MAQPWDSRGECTSVKLNEAESLGRRLIVIMTSYNLAAAPKPQLCFTHESLSYVNKLDGATGNSQRSAVTCCPVGLDK